MAKLGTALGNLVGFALGNFECAMVGASLGLKLNSSDGNVENIADG